MTQYHFARDNAFPFEFEGIKGSAYGTSEAFSHSSISHMDVDGERKLTSNTTSDIIFYILSGEGVFVIDGQRFSIKPSDVLHVPKNTQFGYFGTMQFVEVMTPAWFDGSDQDTDQSPRDIT